MSLTRRPLSPFTTCTLLALVVNAAAYALEFIWLGPDREVSIVVGCLLVASALIATGWRWPPALGALLAGAIAMNNPFLLYNLSHPEHVGFFAAAVIQGISGVVVVGAGISATVQNYRRRVQRTDAA